MNDKKALLNEIRALDFALLETGLYLNAYDCEEAKDYFKMTQDKREQLVHEYETNYSPLRMENGMKNGHWQWHQGPWPWESEAN